MTITVQEITDREQWNNFLTSQPRGHLHQSYEWGELNRYLGRPIYRLGALEQGRMVGSMLLTVSPIPLPLAKLLPRWLYCLRGPTVEQPNFALATIIKRAEEIARQERAVMLRLEPNVADDDPDMDAWIASYQALGFRTTPYALYPRRSWVLDIRPDIEHLLANFKMTWRQNVRVAERKGVIVREAENDSETLAAKMLIRFGDWCWDLYGASSNNKRNLKPTYLLQYRCFEWAKARGCNYFDFRAIPEVLEPGEEMWGVYEFKQGFGGFSRLNIPTQDRVARPLIYTAWRKYVEIRRTQELEKHKKVEMEKAARAKIEGKDAVK